MENKMSNYSTQCKKNRRRSQPAELDKLRALIGYTSLKSVESNTRKNIKDKAIAGVVSKCGTFSYQHSERCTNLGERDVIGWDRAAAEPLPMDEEVNHREKLAGQWFFRNRSTASPPCSQQVQNNMFTHSLGHTAAVQWLPLLCMGWNVTQQPRLVSWEGLYLLCNCLPLQSIFCFLNVIQIKAIRLDSLLLHHSTINSETFLAKTKRTRGVGLWLLRDYQGWEKTSLCPRD